jgi:hypothetical protein
MGLISMGFLEGGMTLTMICGEATAPCPFATACGSTAKVCAWKLKAYPLPKLIEIRNVNPSSWMWLNM